MVSPFWTLQSSNSLRKSIASLAWFNASCIDILPSRLFRRVGKGALLRAVPTSVFLSGAIDAWHGAALVVGRERSSWTAPLPTLQARPAHSKGLTQQQRTQGRRYSAASFQMRPWPLG